VGDWAGVDVDVVGDPAGGVDGVGVGDVVELGPPHPDVGIPGTPEEMPTLTGA
jgi:hypothetical protein